MPRNNRGNCQYDVIDFGTGWEVHCTYCPAKRPDGRDVWINHLTILYWDKGRKYTHHHGYMRSGTGGYYWKSVNSKAPFWVRNAVDYYKEMCGRDAWIRGSVYNN